MRNLLFTVAIILIIGWLVGFFGFHAAPVIHVSLIAGLVIIILSLAGERKIA